MKVKMTVSQQIKAVRANPFSVLEIQEPHIVAVIEAVRANPQLADKVVRELPYEYIVEHFEMLERIIVTAAKQSKFAGSKMNIPYYLHTYAVHAALKAAGADVGKYPEPKSSREVLEFIS